MTSTKRGFTLVEMLVVVGMLAVLMAAITASYAAAQARARVEKARGDVKVISQAILASENYARQGGEYILEPMGGTAPSGGQDADSSTLRDLLGQGRAAESGGRIPALLMAALRADGTMRDPWGTPYKIQIRKGNANVKFTSAVGNLKTGYFLPNFYRLSAEERQ